MMSAQDKLANEANATKTEPPLCPDANFWA